MSIDAFEEIQIFGQFGVASLTLLTRFAWQEIERFRVLQPPEGWNADSVADLTQDFFVKKGKAVTQAVLTQTHDLDSMSKYLRICLRHFLIDLARRTPMGAIRLKVEDILRKTTSLFAIIPKGSEAEDWWYVNGGSKTTYGGPLQTLVAAAKSVTGIKHVRWSGKRRSPLASDADLTKLLVIIFGSAKGSLEVSTLTAVFVERFPAALEHSDANLDQDQWDFLHAPLEDRPEIVWEITESALEVYEQLSHSQRAIFPHLDKPPKDRMEILGLGKSQTALHTRELKEMLKRMIPDDKERLQVISEIYRLCVVNP